MAMGACEFCHIDVIYFAPALVIYRTSSMRVHIPTQKSEKATASSASLLVTPVYVNLTVKCLMTKLLIL